MRHCLLTLLLLLSASSSGSLWADDEQKDESTRYVHIDTSSNDAVIQDGTDFFEAKPLCRLLTNQEVTLLGEKDGQYVKIRAECDGKSVEGWVKKIILGKKPRVNEPKVTPSGAIDSASIAAPASMDHGIVKPPEGEDADRENDSEKKER
ncbi:MAG: SH3 domain-containing protein [Xanthomonadales bacterium]|nr:SH3 domain-containing protein [Xanthomonadales bacterium]NNL94791.1 SH3 domain-containing protein [Xanthomonadales bacterium]